MIQLNLLPDVKKEYIKAKRTRRLIISVSVIVSAASVFIVFLLFSYVQFAQKNHIDNLSEDIADGTKTIQQTENINTMLTVQNQLNLLPGLHEQKSETSRLFTYLERLIPTEAQVARLTVDLDNETLTIIGEADSIATIDKLVEALNLARYNEGESEGLVPFRDISTQLSGENESASFNISMGFDPVIFDNTLEIVLYIDQSASVNTVDVTE